MEAMIQFNYMLDLSWFMNQLPPENEQIPVYFIHGQRDVQSLERLTMEMERYPNVRAVVPHLPIAYGTHHTKMMLLFFTDSTMQIVIHTANLVSLDWRDKTQGVWTSPRLPKKLDDIVHNRSPLQFEVDLCEYLSAYGQICAKVKQRIENYDFDVIPAVRKLPSKLGSFDFQDCVFVGSVPGWHAIGIQKDKWGHLKLRRVLSEQFQATDDEECSIICQYSSCGSLGKDSSWLCGEFLKSLSATKQASRSKCNLKLIYPTVLNVRESFEGYDAGGSLPFDCKNYEKQRSYMQSLLHEWKANSSGRSRAMPHIKTYCRTKDGTASWFLLTSANLSKAAWGSMNREGTKLMIRSYEAGILLIPKNKMDIETVVPYDYPLSAYSAADECWTWNKKHTQPDIFGQTL